jgi:hypothetical protein
MKRTSVVSRPNVFARMWRRFVIAHQLSLLETDIAIDEQELIDLPKRIRMRKQHRDALRV